VTQGAVLLENKEVNEPGPDRAVGVPEPLAAAVAHRLRQHVRLAVDKVFSGSAKSRRERHAWVMHNLELVQMGHARTSVPRKSRAA